MSKVSHPKGLYLLFVTEMWERFSYYGMRAIFALYLIKALLMNKDVASNLYGNYTGLVYLTPLLGGYIADRYIGNSKSVVLGGIMMAVGQFFLFLSASYYQEFSVASVLMFVGLFFLILGNGFFKPNMSTMVGRLYEPDDKRKDSAYTIFYMGINLGAFFSPLVCGTFGETDNPADFKWGFLAACVGMVIGVLLFVLFKDKYLVTAEGHPIDLKQNKKEVIDESGSTQFNLKKLGWIFVLEILLFLFFYYIFDGDYIGAVIFSFCISVPSFIISDPSLTKIEKRKIWTIYILAFFTIFFWSAFEQAGASLTYFTEEHTDRYIGGTEIKTSYFQSLNAVFIVLLAPVFSSMWMFLESKGISVSSTRKQSLGMLLLALGFFVLAVGADGLNTAQKVSLFWVVAHYYILTLGELCLSPIGLSLVNKLSPARFATLLMGVWLLSSATANKFCGMLSALYPEVDKATGSVVATSFLGYQIASFYDFFMLFVYSAVVASIIMFMISGRLNKVIEE